MAGQDMDQLWAHRRQVVDSAPFGSRPASKPRDTTTKQARTLPLDAPSFLGQGDSTTAATSVSEGFPVRRLRRPAWMDDPELLREEAARKVHLLHEGYEQIDHDREMVRLGFKDPAE